ncbi:hypothetical protein BT63DRAFT_440818 [Microthyrium microscopicum]|uniref:F-box domain-containing protein n=1 Tax=Microthyrium microscopicum TaxID=703497 RepID=A0A6A6UB93_9PEZI|nr:hypothetical protein BT63DRAFT_440818 [Microthyrium microscopicum]
MQYQKYYWTFAMGIDSLPLELVQSIYRYLDPAYHLNFALTNKKIFNQSQSTLENHQKCSRSFRNWSFGTSRDNNGVGLVDLLSTVAFDHVAAWHVQTLELKYNSTTEIIDAVSESSLQAVTRLVNAAMTANGIPAFTLRRIREGNVEALQFALIAFSSGLHTLKLENYPLPVAVGDEEREQETNDELWRQSEKYGGYIEQSNQNLFSNIIRATLEIDPQPLWSPGFQCLQHIIIRSPIEPSEPVSEIDAMNVASVFLLPNISSIYLRGLAFHGAAAEAGTWAADLRLPKRSSTVQHLFLELAQGGEVKYAVNTILASAKCLKTFILKDCEFNDFDISIGILAQDTPQSTLETLLWSDEPGWLTGYRCSKFDPDEVVQHMGSIRILTLDIFDIFLGYEGRLSGIVENSNQDSFVTWLGYSLNCYLETLVIKCSDRLSEADLRAINDAVVELMQFKEEQEEEYSDEEDQGEGDQDQDQDQDEEVRNEKEEDQDEVDRDEEGEDGEDQHEEDEDGGHCLSRIREIYLDEVVDSYARGFERYQSSRPDRQSDQDRVFARSLFDQAVDSTSKYDVNLCLDKGATLRYFQKVCDQHFES